MKPAKTFEASQAKVYPSGNGGSEAGTDSHSVWCVTRTVRRRNAIGAWGGGWLDVGEARTEGAALSKRVASSQDKQLFVASSR